MSWQFPIWENRVRKAWKGPNCTNYTEICYFFLRKVYTVIHRAVKLRESGCFCALLTIHPTSFKDITA